MLKNITHYTFGKLGLAGYSQYPWIARPATDGIVMIHTAVGAIGTGSFFTKTALTHEAAHWLGCFHTFEGGCTGGDMVYDTPHAAANRYSIFSCDTTKNTCASDTPNLPDQIENYMDYASASCQNMFTTGQKARMDAALAQWRPVISTLQNLIATGTHQATIPANCAPIADFVALDNEFNPQKTSCANRWVNFHSTAYNYTGPVTYHWIFEGGTPAISGLPMQGVEYKQPGTYDVTLIVSNANGTDTLVKKDYIEITPVIAALKAPFVQDFETLSLPDAQWTVNSNTYKNFSITDVGMGTVITGNPTALFVENNETLSGSAFSFTTPALDISGMANPVFSFYYAFAPGGTGTASTNDALAVHHSADCGQSWKLLWLKKGDALSTIGGGTTLPFFPSHASKWKQVTIPLISFAQVEKQNIRFRIVFTSDGGNNFFLDALNIGFPAALPDDYFSSEANLTLYPNPSHGAATIKINLPAKSKITVSASDVLGREIATIADNIYSEGMHSFDFAPGYYFAPGGIYFIKLVVNGSTYYKKLVCSH